MAGFPPLTARPVLLDAGPCDLSGLLAVPDGPPRGTVVALHGGGMNATYFHGGALPELSLLTLGAAAGWNVLALDRPGYGASTGLAPELSVLRAQADLVFHALDAFAASHDVGTGYVACGHSYGLKLAIHLGAHPRGGELLGLDGSGAGRRYRAERTPHVTQGTRQLSRQEAVLLFWGPPKLYPPGTFRPGRGLIEEVPDTENREASTWPDQFDAVAAAVRVPVRLTFANHENWWVCDDAELAAIAAAFTAAPSVDTTRQPGAGHNISLGWAARAYHLAVLAFAERCLLRARENRPALEAW
ncbi:alpha/beta hydrolase [Pseudofrankia sp. BMG5.37]|uniref:alpha/beta hydrolase n=1 Tax=Pseudofrankia sp. BMG5.37 TaxID=3050035 RepID=UPI0028947FDF|nr:alpha/beta hydrolase [Pseudofrankia sp. BMG5.37]MDT3441901.1 alpha/beta hydrolase [Pseudofrankia sp. BMG5.37]